MTANMYRRVVCARTIWQRSVQGTRILCHIIVDIGGLLGAHHVVAVNQSLNAFLEIYGLRENGKRTILCVRKRERERERERERGGKERERERWLRRETERKKERQFATLQCTLREGQGQSITMRRYSLVQWNWFSDITDKCNSGASSDHREPISLHQAVHTKWQSSKNVWHHTHELTPQSL